MNKEKSIEIIKYVKESFDKFFSNTEDKNMMGEALDLAIFALEEQQADRWIPVTKELPEHGNEVLISYDGHTCYGFYDKVSKVWYEYYLSTPNERVNLNVEAWRELPEPYKEESI